MKYYYYHAYRNWQIKRILLTVNCNLILYANDGRLESVNKTYTYYIIHTTSGDNLFIDYVVRVRQPSIDGIHYSTGIWVSCASAWRIVIILYLYIYIYIHKHILYNMYTFVLYIICNRFFHYKYRAWRCDEVLSWWE